MLCCSEEEARQKIYSVSTRHYFAFGCLVSEELSYKIKGINSAINFFSELSSSYIHQKRLILSPLLHNIAELPKVRWVLPDSYLDVKNKDYGGERQSQYPFAI